MKKTIVIIFALTLFPLLWSDFSGMNNGTRSLGMGNSYGAMAERSQSLFYNAAGTAGISESEISSSYQNQFGISDLLNLNLATTLPQDNLVYGFAVQQVNLLDVYNENIFYFNTAWLLRHHKNVLRLGMNLRYYHIGGKEAEIELSKPFDLDLGVLYTHRGISLGYSNRNLLRNEVNTDEINQNHLLSLAVKWQNLLNYTADYEISEDDSKFRTGIELWFYDTFAPRLGLDDKYLTMGFGLKASWWSFDFGLKTHEELGTSYRFGFNIKYKRISL